MQFELSRANTPPRFLATDRRPAWRPLRALPQPAPFAQVLSTQQKSRPEMMRASNSGPIMPLPEASVRRASAQPYSDLIAAASKTHGVDPALIAGVIESESSFNPNAVSHAGAKGLMQLMDATARGLGVTDPFDPKQNVMGGTKLLRQLLDRYGGDVRLALAAYNAGPGAVSQYGGVPPYAETQRYIPRVLAAMERHAPTETQAMRSIPQRSEQWR